MRVLSFDQASAKSGFALYDDGKLLRNTFFNQGQCAVTHHYRAFVCFDVWIQIFCEEEIVANSLNCYISDSRDDSLLNFEQQSCTTMYGCLFIVSVLDNS